LVGLPEAGDFRRSAGYGAERIGRLARWATAGASGAPGEDPDDWFDFDDAPQMYHQAARASFVTCQKILERIERSRVA